MPNKTATFNTTAGSFTVELYTDTMPVTACKTPAFAIFLYNSSLQGNFIDLAQNGFYNGLHFHRVIKDFMNQFGNSILSR